MAKARVADFKFVSNEIDYPWDGHDVTWWCPVCEYIFTMMTTVDGTCPAKPKACPSCGIKAGPGTETSQDD